MLVFDVRDVDLKIVQRLDQPRIVEAKTTSAFAYTMLRCDLRPKDYAILRRNRVDVLTHQEFRDFTKSRPAPLNQSSPLLQRLCDERLDIKRLQCPIELSDSATVWSLAKASGVEFVVYHALAVMTHLYLDLGLKGTQARKERFTRAAEALGIRVYAPPQNGKTIWCSHLRHDVEQAMKHVLKGSRVSPKHWVDLIERCYPRFPSAATPWYWFDQAEFDKDFDQQQSWQLDPHVLSLLGQSEFAQSLAEFHLLEAMAVRLHLGSLLAEPRDILPKLSDLAREHAERKNEVG